MTYANLITRLSYELRDPSAWPADSSKQAEQLNLLYNAALAVASVIPLGRLTLVSSATLTGIAQGSLLKRYDLRAVGVDIFDSRYSAITGVQDMGIASIRLDGQDNTPSGGISVESIQAIGNQSLHAGQDFFALDYDHAQLYITGDPIVTLWYVKKPPYPAAPADTWPLANDNDTERAIHITAAHVNGVTVRDSAATQMQALLQKTYNN